MRAVDQGLTDAALNATLRALFAVDSESVLLTLHSAGSDLMSGTNAERAELLPVRQRQC